MVWDSLVQWIGVELWHLPYWFTRLEIARDIGVRKSPSLIAALKRATEEGMLVSITGKDDAGRRVIMYRICDEYRESQLEGAKNYGKR